MNHRIIVIALLMFQTEFAGASTPAQLTVAPAPDGAPLSRRCRVRLRPVGTESWQSAPVYSFFKQHDYNWALTAESEFVTFDSLGAIDVEVTMEGDANTPVVRPLNRNIAVRREGATLRFTMTDNARQICLEVNGDPRHPLVLFSNPPETDAPKAGDPNVTWFGPGYHKAGPIKCSGGGKTVYLAPGAVVEGALAISDGDGVAVRGRGILYRPYPKDGEDNSSPLNTYSSKNVRVEGIVLVNRADNWTLRPVASRDVTFENFHLLSEIRDGLDIINSQSVTVRDSFFMTHDDAICLKGLSEGKRQPVEDVLVERCVIANMGGGNCLEIGYESVTPVYQRVTFQNLDLIHSLPNGEAPDPYWPEAAISIHPTQMQEYGSPEYMGTMPPVRNVTYRDVRIESCSDDFYFDIRPNRNSPGTGIENILLENVSVVDSPSRPSRIVALPNHPIHNVTIRGLSILGRPVTNAEQGRITVSNTECKFEPVSVNHHVESVPGRSEFPGAEAWRAMRVGLFIHWGPSSGRALPQSHSHARKSALNPSGSVPSEVYDQFYKEFNPTNYNPDAWLKLAHDAGMRYAVFVAKHHDGFCMFKTDATDYNIMATPYGKDVAAMFASACKHQGIALGWQFSPKDWKHPDFNTPGHDRYNAYYEKLIDDLSANYGPLSVLWFDGIEPAGPDMWKQTPDRVAKMLHERHPQIMLGVHGGCAEDFLSFEETVGPFDRRQPWEMCEAINPSGWVFNQPMPPFPLRGLLRNLVYTIARDGNYLLDVGPMPDGRIYPPDAERLGEIAAWMKVNAEGIHGTRGGPYRDGEWGGATCKDSAVYLFIADRAGVNLTLPALAAEVRSARRLDGGQLDWKADAASLRLALSDRAQGRRPVFVCVKLELDRPAFPLPLVDVQANLAATARLSPSSVLGSAATQLLFDNDGDTTWETEPGDTLNALDMDLGESRLLGSLSLSERAPRQFWNNAYKLELKTRDDPNGEWQTVLKHTGTLGGPPILDLKPVRARYVRLELAKFRPHPLQISELRLFAPLEP